MPNFLIDISNKNRIIKNKNVKGIFLDIAHIREYEFVNIHYKLFDMDNELILSDNITISEKKYNEILEGDGIIDYVLWFIQ